MATNPLWILLFGNLTSAIGVDPNKPTCGAVSKRVYAIVSSGQGGGILLRIFNVELKMTMIVLDSN